MALSQTTVVASILKRAALAEIRYTPLWMANVKTFWYLYRCPNASCIAVKRDML